MAILMKQILSRLRSRYLILTILFNASISAFANDNNCLQVTELYRKNGESKFSITKDGLKYFVIFKDIPNTDFDSIYVYNYNEKKCLLKSTIETLDTLEIVPFIQNGKCVLAIKTGGNGLIKHLLFLEKEIKIVKAR